MKILIVSDLHMNREASHAISLASRKVPFTFVGGDIGARRTDETRDIVDYMSRTFKSEHTLLTPGNHDFWPVNSVKLYGGSPNIRVVVDRAVHLYDGDTSLLVWFSPWSRQFCDWNWMLDSDEDTYAIPEEVDMIVTHGPAYDICDRCPNGDNAGSRGLKEAIEKTRAKYVFSGHIHGTGFAKNLSAERSWYNTSVLDEMYWFKGKLPVFDTKTGEMEYWEEKDWQ